MKKKILIGVILSCFLLLVTPCINAIQLNEVKEEKQREIKFHLLDMIKKSIDISSNEVEYQMNVLNLFINALICYLIFAYIVTFIETFKGQYQFLLDFFDHYLPEGVVFIIAIFTSLFIATILFIGEEWLFVFFRILEFIKDLFGIDNQLINLELPT